MEKHTPKIHKARRVLEFIGSAPDGRTLKEIQTFILVMNGYRKWLDRGYLRFNARGELERTPKGRGYWCDYLYGLNSPYASYAGLLPRYCTQLPNRKWKVTEPIEGPFRSMKKPTRSYLANFDRARGAWLRHKESLPKCKGCGRPMESHNDLTPDGEAHINSWSGAYHGDCRGRVWRVEKIEYRSKPGQLTKLTKHDIWVAEAMARKLTSNYEEQVQKVWELLGEYVVPYLKGVE